MPSSKRKRVGTTDTKSVNRNSRSNTNKNMGGGSRRSRMTGSSRGAVISQDVILQMFANYSGDINKFSMDMEGICKLCEDIDIDPENDVRVLVLLWKLGANARPGEISKEEWLNGCQNLHLDSSQKFKDLMPGLDLGFLDREEFKSFFKFCFQFHREGTHRTLDSGLVISLLKLLLVNGRVDQTRLDSFCEFLETKCASNTGNERITLDQWTSFLELCYEVNDFLEYDEDGGAWPVLLDEYVEWMLKKMK